VQRLVMTGSPIRPMSGRFDAYEFLGIVAPGAIVVFGASLVFPEVKAYIADSGVTVGGLGIFLILSYVVGHLVQAFGNLLEKAVWFPFGGMPTQWVLKRNQRLLATAQTEKLFSAIRASHPGFDPEGTTSRSDWFSITREIYARVSGVGKSARIDAFNRNYGLLRGIAASLLVSVVLAGILGLAGSSTLLLMVVALMLAIYRMYRFGVHYGRELFVTFLSLSNDIMLDGRKTT